jgi:histidinol-phosphate/aromatic aminotransferase/cobyric acid decarboxylase-like protein/choline kinase
MKAIILAAGYGHRMRPLTDQLHKTLLQVNGREIIWRLVASLSQRGVSDMVVVTGYRAEELSNFLLGAFPEVEFTFVHNDRFLETNNIYSLALAFEAVTVDQDVLLIECDLVIEDAILDRIMHTRHENVALVDRYRSGMDGTVVTVEEERITNVIPPHLQDAKFDFSDKYKTLNIYKFSEQFCNKTFRDLLVYYARTINDNCYYELILGLLIYMQQEIVHAEVLDGERWAEVDDPNDLRVAEFVFNPDKRYESLESTFGGYWAHDVTDFAFIRNMYFPTSSIISEMRHTLPALITNYGSRQQVLNEKLAYFLLVAAEQVMVLNGASQVYPWLAERFQGRTVAAPSPTFGEYGRIFSDIQGYSDNVGLSNQSVAAAAETADLVVVVNPNNPTGSTLDTTDLFQLVRERENKWFIVDESFIDFSSQESMVGLLTAEPLQNVLVIKSLSKVLGVPGLRLGYIMSPNLELMKWMHARVPIWNLNSMAEFFLEMILKHRRVLSESIERTISDREDFIRDLDSCGWVKQVFPSGGNFILVEMEMTPDDTGRLLRTLLTKHSVLVKDVSSRFSGHQGMIRIAVRTHEENCGLISLVSQSLENESKQEKR